MAMDRRRYLGWDRNQSAILFQGTRSGEGRSCRLGWTLIWCSVERLGLRGSASRESRRSSCGGGGASQPTGSRGCTAGLWTSNTMYGGEEAAESAAGRNCPWLGERILGEKEKGDWFLRGMVLTSHCCCRSRERERESGSIVLCYVMSLLLVQLIRGDKHPFTR